MTAPDLAAAVQAVADEADHLTGPDLDYITTHTHERRVEIRLRHPPTREEAAALLARMHCTDPIHTGGCLAGLTLRHDVMVTVAIPTQAEGGI